MILNFFESATDTNNLYDILHNMLCYEDVASSIN